MTLSRSGQIRSPCRVTSSPMLTTAVTSAPGLPHRAHSEQEARAADPAGQNHDAHAPILPTGTTVPVPAGDRHARGFRRSRARLRATCRVYR